VARGSTLFVDTWGWLALEDRRDSAHSQVLQLYRDFRARNVQAVTTDYVLDETMTLLFRRRPFEEAQRFVEGLLAAAEAQYLSIQRITAERFSKAWRLRLRYHDKKDISFTDLTSFVVMQEHRIAEILTDDQHFKQVNLGFVTLP
jgi:predicted nucleic acid-binding protein